MKKLSLIVAITMVLAIGLWMLNPTQSSAKELGAEAGVTSSAPMSGVVVGKPVRSDRGVVLGTIQNIVLTDNGCAKYVILSGQFSGEKSRLFPIPWTVIARTGPDAIFVDLDPAILVEAPSFEVNRWPDFAQWDTRIHSFYQKRAEVTTQGKTRNPGVLAPDTAAPGVRSEEKARSEKDFRAKQKDWEKQATEGAGSAEKKAIEEKTATEKSMEKERKQTPSKTGTQGAVESPKHREMDIKAKQHTEPKAGGTTGTMERGQSQMMERGKSQERNPAEKGAPGQVGVPGIPGQAGEKIK